MGINLFNHLVNIIKMAKRMTSNDIWQKEWFMTLKPRLKCLVRFIWDNCDNSGVWSPNWTLASMMIGEPVSITDIQKIDHGNRHEILSNGKIWIKDFVKFQCGNFLNEKSPPHKKVIDLLTTHGLIDRVVDTLTNRVHSTPKEEEEEIESYTEAEIENEGERLILAKSKKPAKSIPEVVYPFDDEQFKSSWLNWKQYKKTEFKFQYKSIQSEQSALVKISNLATTSDEAIEILKEAMANGWKGFFQIDKKQKNDKTNSAQNTATAILKKRGLL